MTSSQVSLYKMKLRWQKSEQGGWWYRFVQIKKEHDRRARQHYFFFFITSSQSVAPRQETLTCVVYIAVKSACWTDLFWSLFLEERDEDDIKCWVFCRMLVIMMMIVYSSVSVCVCVLTGEWRLCHYCTVKRKRHGQCTRTVLVLLNRFVCLFIATFFLHTLSNVFTIPHCCVVSTLIYISSCFCSVRLLPKFFFIIIPSSFVWDRKDTIIANNGSAGFAMLNRSAQLPSAAIKREYPTKEGSVVGSFRGSNN